MTSQLPRLWVDDLRNPPQHSVESYDIARTYNQAIDFLLAKTYEYIYLDHDLGDYSGPDGREMTGYDVLMWIVEKKQDGFVAPTRYEILTANPVGRKRFEGVIERYLSP